jgi:hypothetical protein
MSKLCKKKVGSNRVIDGQSIVLMKHNPSFNFKWREYTINHSISYADGYSI